MIPLLEQKKQLDMTIDHAMINNTIERVAAFLKVENEIKGRKLPEASVDKTRAAKKNSGG